MCFAHTVTQRIRYAARIAKKSGSKAAHGGDKTEQGGTLPPPAWLAKLPSGLCACPRPPARKKTLEEDSFRPERRRLRREGAVVFCWLSLPRPASNRARHASRPMRLCSIRAFTTFTVPSILRGTSPSSCPGRHIRAPVVAARRGRIRAPRCARLLYI